LAFSIRNGVQQHRVNFNNDGESMTTNLIYGDYKIVEGSAWFEVKNFAIKIHQTDEGVVVDIFQNGLEDQDPVASTYAFDNELEAA
jgi:hypothetical protein